MDKIVLIGDVVDSQAHPDRRKLQDTLNVKFKSICVRRKDIISPYTITLGDEFQAVYGRAGRIFNDSLSILSVVHPTRVRFSLGIGTIVTPINRKQALGMDGEAFYNARNGLNRLKQSNSIYKITAKSGADYNFCNKVLDLISYLMQDWNGNRLKILDLIMRQIPPKDISSETRLSSVSIYKNINKGALKIVEELFGDIAVKIDGRL
jgi:hypothetical protein